MNLKIFISDVIKNFFSSISRWHLAQKLFAIVILAILIFSPFVNPVNAKSLPSPVAILQNDDVTDKKCWPLDVIVLIDQSGSMMGISGNNDPDGYRFDAAREVLDELARNAQDQCEGSVHRFAVLTFGTTATVHLPLRIISLNRDDEPEVVLKQYFDSILRAEDSSPESYTNFALAFQAAKKVFENAPTVVDDLEKYGPRRQVVVLITDGKPTTSKDTSQTLMCELKTTLKDAFWSTKSIWIVALNADVSNDEDRNYLSSRGCNGTIEQDLQEIALSHKGELIALPYNAQTIPKSLGIIVSNEFGQTSESVSCEDVFYVDPYLQREEFRFYRNKNDSNSRVTIYKLDDSSGQPVFVLQDGKVVDSVGNIQDMGLKEYIPSPSREIYIVENPLPGAWKYVVEGMDKDECQHKIDGVKINFFAEILLEPGGILPQVSSEPYHKEQKPVYFRLKLRNEDTLKEITNNYKYPLDVLLTWKLPSGKESLPNGSPILPVPLYPVGGGYWENRDLPVLTPEIGKYTLEITGSAPSADPNDQAPKEVFREIKYYDADLLTSFEYSVMTPSGGSQACNQFVNQKSVSKPLEVQIQIQDDSGKTVSNPRDFVTSDLNKSFFAELLDTNQNILDSIYLTQLSDGVFGGKLLDGKESLVGCGHVTLRLKFTGNYDPKKFTLLGGDTEISLDLVEAQGIQAEVLTPAPNSVIHRFDSIWDACSSVRDSGSTEKIAPIRIELRLTDLKGQQLNPVDVLNEGSVGLYQAFIKGPFSSAEEGPIDLVSERTNHGYVLTGNGGTSVVDAGEYQLRIVPVQNSFSSKYTWLKEQDQIVIRFTREDGVLSNAVACRVARFGRGILYFIFLFLFLFAITGGPGGNIQFLDDRGDLLKPWKLSRMRLMRLMKYSSPSLAEKGIKYVQFSKGASGKGMRSVNVKAVDIGGGVIWDSNIQAGLVQSITPDVSVMYSHPKHKETSEFV